MTKLSEKLWKFKSFVPGLEKAALLKYSASSQDLDTDIPEAWVSHSWELDGIS